MYSTLDYTKRIIRKSAAIILVLTPGLMMLSCGRSNFLNSFLEPKRLMIEAADKPEAKEPILHELFSFKPGDLVPLNSFSGTVDPVGTTLHDDFDGDGIANSRETASNVWVADYPMIEINTAFPVTMKIEFQDSSGSSTKALSNEIASSDVEENTQKSSEAVHRNEVNLRTVQFQDSFDKSASLSMKQEQNMSVSANVSFMVGSANAMFSQSSSVAMAMNTSYGATETKWKDVPFKNHLGRNESSVKRDVAEKKAQTMRNELRSSLFSNLDMKSNAGYIRATLYISNESVNMPVRMKNILCSFMLETPEGQLLPVQSFRLKNDDYSMFEIELYGGETFGPYVIELAGLNSYEIKQAIALGYNPRIFIIDYDMVHVKDSNYRAALSGNFTGNNLKIIEENAKGRTAAIKLVGPGFREFFRVAAFDAVRSNGAPVQESRTTRPGEVSEISPGVSMEKALRRISYSGIPVEFADYVLDFTDIDPKLVIRDPNGEPYPTSRIFVRGIRSLNGAETKLPVKMVTPEGVIVMKPLADWQPEDYSNFKLWVIFDKGRYFNNAGELSKNPLAKGTVEGEYVYNDGTGTVRVPRIQGITGCIWPGDHYDLVYLNLSEVLGLVREYGNNALEAEKTLPFNTRWKRSDLGAKPFDPDNRSRYLGRAVRGDTIELKIKLNKTRYLNPSFGQGTPVANVTTGATSYSSYTYDMNMPEYTWFGNDEALDFEVSFGADGNYCDWINLFPDRSPYAFWSAYYTNVAEDSFRAGLDYYWDYLAQEFTVRFRVPDNIPGMGENGETGVYLRTALNNVYRDTIWPLRGSEVKQFRGRALNAQYDGALNRTIINVEYPIGSIQAGDTLVLGANGQTCSVVSAPAELANPCQIAVQGDMCEAVKKGDWVYVTLASPLSDSDTEVKIAIDDTFIADWNSECADPYTNLTGGWNGEHDGWRMPLLADGNNTEYHNPVQDLGFNPDHMAANWMGNDNKSNPLWNNWSDASGLADFMNRQLASFLATTSGAMLRLFNSIHLADPNWYNRGNWGSDFPVNTTSNYYSSKPKSVINNNHSLVVWRSPNADVTAVYLRGRFFDLTTGQGIDLNGQAGGGDSTITSGVASYDITSSNNRALVTWNNGHSITGQMYNMTSCQSVGNVISFDSSNPFLSTDESQLVSAASNNRAIVVWRIIRQLSSISTSSVFVHVGRILDLTTGNFITDPFEIDSDVDAMQVVASNNRALVSWSKGNEYSTRYYVRTIDLIDGNMSEPILITSGNSKGGISNLKADQDQALLVINKPDVYSSPIIGTYTGNILYGYIINMTTGQAVASDLEIGPAGQLYQDGSSYQYEQIARVAMKDNHAIIIYFHPYYSLVGRVIDMANRTVDPDTIVVMNNVSLYNNHAPTPEVDVDADDNGALVAWHNNNSSDNTIYGRIIDLSSGNCVHDPFPISTYNAYSQLSPIVKVMDNRAFVIWNSMNNSNGMDIRGNIFYTDPLGSYMSSFPHGLSNFFVAPMIERDYSVTVKYVEDK